MCEKYVRMFVDRVIISREDPPVYAQIPKCW